MEEIEINDKARGKAKNLMVKLFATSKTDISRMRTNNDWQDFYAHFWTKDVDLACQNFTNYLFEKNPTLNRTITRMEVYTSIRSDLYESTLSYCGVEVGKERIFIKALANESKALTKYLKKLQSDLQSMYADADKATWLIVCAISDVRVESHTEFQFGGITFFPKGKKRLEKLVGNVITPKSNVLQSSVDQLQRTFKKEKMLAYFLCSGCSSGYLSQRAADIFNNTFSILRLGIALNRTGGVYLHSKDRMGIASKEIVGVGDALWLKQDLRLNNSFFVPNDQTTADLPFAYEKKYLARLESFAQKQHIKSLLERVVQDELSETDKVVMESLNWFSDGLCNFNPLHRYVLFTIALEKILAHKAKYYISSLFNKRGAILMGKNTEEKTFENFYDVRSKIVHGEMNETYQIPEEHSIWRLGLYVPTVMEKFIELVHMEKITSMQKFNEHVDARNVHPSFPPDNS